MHFIFGNKYKYKVDILHPLRYGFYSWQQSWHHYMIGLERPNLTHVEITCQHQDVAITVGSFIRRSCTTPKGKPPSNTWHKSLFPTATSGRLFPVWGVHLGECVKASSGVRSASLSRRVLPNPPPCRSQRYSIVRVLIGSYVRPFTRWGFPTEAMWWCSSPLFSCPVKHSQVSQHHFFQIRLCGGAHCVLVLRARKNQLFAALERSSRLSRPASLKAATFSRIWNRRSPRSRVRRPRPCGLFLGLFGSISSLSFFRCCFFFVFDSVPFGSWEVFIICRET